jgi:hypothetical protein
MDQEESRVYTSVADPWHFGVDPDPDPDPRIHASDKWIRIRIRIRILLFSSMTFKMPAKN